MAQEAYVGIMTGTSVDGIDAVLVDFSKQPPAIGQLFHEPFADDLRDLLLKLQARGDDELARAADAAGRLASSCARAVAAVLAEQQVAPEAVTAIGLHGQTVRHNPKAGWTIQLANGALLAQLAGIDVVCDFRSCDIARGGQGAPLAPLFHRLIFAAAKPRRIVNIGGMANITLLGENGKGVGAYDTGPGCALLDGMAARHLGCRLDENGAWAAGAAPDAGLLARLLAHPFFAAAAPKSCGRDQFNMSWLDDIAGDIDPQVVQATLLELTAESVAAAIGSSELAGDGDVIICGGGARNEALVGRICELAHPLPTASCLRHGYPPECIEPAAFAYLAKLRSQGRPIAANWATGATADGCAGAIYRGRRLDAKG